MNIMFFNLFLHRKSVDYVNLIIDIGNTTAKIAVFEKNEMVDVINDSNSSFYHLEELIQKYQPAKGILSTVVPLSADIERQISNLPFKMMKLDATTNIPVQNMYRTPNTLGSDRLAAVVGAYTLNNRNNILVVDAGTCITYEFLDSEGRYWGGNISPGLNIRMKAMHAMTASLPEITLEGETPDFGFDTTTALRSGITKGVTMEIEGYIRKTKVKHPDLMVFLTGGDSEWLANSLDDTIVTNKNLVLIGLNRILDEN